MQKNFSLAESILREKFLSTDKFKFNGTDHKLILCAKPSPSSGECKTDIYVSAKNLINKENIEIKISLKLDNYEFLENKISETTAKIIFGKKDYRAIIIAAATSLKERFLEKAIFKKNDNKITQIPLGWKIELFHDTKRTLRTALDLTLSQKIDILAGTHRPESVKNSNVSGKLILNSGVANYMLILPSDPNEFRNYDLSYFLQKLESIYKYSAKANINAGFTCLNYFPDKNKWDGDRPLAVWIDWTKCGEDLRGRLILDQPFARSGNLAVAALKDIL
jgi:hypothetical protein